MSRQQAIAKFLLNQEHIDMFLENVYNAFDRKLDLSGDIRESLIKCFVKTGCAVETDVFQAFKTTFPKFSKEHITRISSIAFRAENKKTTFFLAGIKLQWGQIQDVLKAFLDTYGKGSAVISATFKPLKLKNHLEVVARAVETFKTCAIPNDIPVKKFKESIPLSRKRVPFFTGYTVRANSPQHDMHLQITEGHYELPAAESTDEESDEAEEDEQDEDDEQDEESEDEAAESWNPEYDLGDLSADFAEQEKVQKKRKAQMARYAEFHKASRAATMASIAAEHQAQKKIRDAQFDASSAAWRANKRQTLNNGERVGFRYQPPFPSLDEASSELKSQQQRAPIRAKISLKPGQQKFNFNS